ncbi:MAG: PfkB family carbohydrate kinase, partial [Acutalibacter sp.]
GCRSPRGQAVSTVGAGDSLVAGFLYGCQLHGTLEGGLKWGVAAGAATAFQEGIATGSQVKAQFPAVGNPHPL